MKYSILIFCVLICMSIIPNKVKGIQCYDCDDLTGENCKNVNDNMIKNCSSLISTCIKTIAKDSDMEYIHRGCGPVIKIIDNDCRDQKVGNYDGTYCECDTDLCNGNKQEEEEEERPEKIVPNNVDGLKCYICDDLLGKPCKSVNDGMIEECAVAKTCLKTVARGPEMEYIHRACGPIISLVDNDCKNQKIGEYDGTYCECSNDLCNGSNDIFKKPSE